MITTMMRIDNLLTDLTSGDTDSIAFKSDLETVAYDLMFRQRKYEAFNLLVTYGRLLECGKAKRLTVSECLRMFVNDARQIFL